MARSKSKADNANTTTVFRVRYADRYVERANEDEVWPEVDALVAHGYNDIRVEKITTTVETMDVGELPAAPEGTTANERLFAMSGVGSYHADQGRVPEPRTPDRPQEEFERVPHVETEPVPPPLPEPNYRAAELHRQAVTGEPATTGQAPRKVGSDG